MHNHGQINEIPALFEAGKPKKKHFNRNEYAGNAQQRDCSYWKWHLYRPLGRKQVRDAYHFPVFFMDETTVHRGGKTAFR